jgi:hypothetical protein
MSIGDGMSLERYKILRDVRISCIVINSNETLMRLYQLVNPQGDHEL